MGTVRPTITMELKCPEQEYCRGYPIGFRRPDIPELDSELGVGLSGRRSMTMQELCRAHGSDSLSCRKDCKKAWSSTGKHPIRLHGGIKKKRQEQ